MSRTILQVEGVAKALGGKSLFEGVTLALEAGDRVALVGPNGCGKSTLIRILASQDTADAGHVRLAPNTRVTLLDQHPGQEKSILTVGAAIAAATAVPPVLAAELAKLEARLADPELYESGEADEVVARYSEVQREAVLARATAGASVENNAMLADLGFAEDAFDRKLASLSGGERTRLFLAIALAQADASGVLILDEPTNHLDVETMEWLEGWLSSFAGAILVTSHDRAFLDNVATRVAAFERGGIVAYPGNYSAFEARREEDASRLAARRDREAKELARQKAVVEQFKHQKRFNGQMASRLTALTKYRTAIDHTPDPIIARVAFNVGFGEAHKSSNEVLRVRGLAKQFGERMLFYDLALDVRKGDRLGIIGGNGAGKTTLLKILTGREKPDLGTIEVPPGVRGAYFAQGHDNLEPERTLRDEVLSARPGLEDPDVRALIGRFGFRNEHDPSRKVKTLSGGERARMALLKIVIGPSNLLILDEPTNHFDLESRGVLVQALNAYKGTLIVVSHDRWFLDSVVNKVGVLARRTLKVFPGDFTEARTASAIDEFGIENPTSYLVKKAFKDYDDDTKHPAGSVIKLTPGDIAEKRVYRTAIQMGWLVEDA